MPSRTPSGLVGDPHRLKALILSRPSVVEEGFRVLDVDLAEAAAPTSRLERQDESTTRTAPAPSSSDEPPSDRSSSDDTIPVAVTAEIVAPADPERDDVLEAFLKEGGAAGPFETLTAEELEEFERFERHRRQRDRNPA